MDGEAWWAIAHGVTKEWDKTWQLNNNNEGTVENSERHENTGPPDLPLEKSVCRLGRNS